MSLIALRTRLPRVDIYCQRAYSNWSKSIFNTCVVFQSASWKIGLNRKSKACSISVIERTWCFPINSDSKQPFTIERKKLVPTVLLRRKFYISRHAYIQILKSSNNFVTCRQRSIIFEEEKNLKTRRTGWVGTEFCRLCGSFNSEKVNSSVKDFYIACNDS